MTRNLERGSASVNATKYGTIPIELFRPRPAVRHRGDDAKDGLTPFEFAIAAAISVLAQAAVGHQRHEQAMKGGAEGIKDERQTHDRFHKEWRETHHARSRGATVGAPEIVHTYDNRLRHKPEKLSVSLTKAGRYGYSEAMKKLRKEPAPDIIRVETSKRELLLTAGLPGKGKNFLLLDLALERLTGSVAGIKPLVISWRQNRSGRLDMKINGRWLDPHYLRLPLPLPGHSTVLALLMFTQSVEATPMHRAGILWTDLCDRIGIDARHKNRKRDLNRTITLLNKYLKGFPDAVADELFRRFNLKVPARYNIHSEGDYVRFTRIMRGTRAASEPQSEGGGYVNARRRRTDDVVRPAPRASEHDDRLQSFEEANRLAQRRETERRARGILEVRDRRRAAAAREFEPDDDYE